MLQKKKNGQKLKTFFFQCSTVNWNILQGQRKVNGLSAGKVRKKQN